MIHYVGILRDKFLIGEQAAMEYIQRNHNKFPPNHFFYVFATLLAIESNYMNVLEYLVLQNGDLDINCLFDEDLATLLIRTVKLHNYEALKVLLQVDGIDIWIKDTYEHSAMYYALSSLREDIAKLLLEYDVNNHNKH